MATEVAVLPLLEGATPHDPTSAAGKILEESFATLAKQPGFQRIYWGTEVEDANNFHLAIDWDSVEAHDRFTKTEGYGAFVSKWSEIVDVSKGGFYHVHLSPHPPIKAISRPGAPVTETLLLYFPASYSKEDQDQFQQNIEKLGSVFQTHGAGSYTGFSGGWVVEDLPIPAPPKESSKESSQDSASEAGSKKEEKAAAAAEQKQTKGKAYLALIGWTSVQAHLDFRNTQAFQDNIHLLRGAKDLRGVKMVHVSRMLVA